MTRVLLPTCTVLVWAMNLALAATLEFPSIGSLLLPLGGFAIPLALVVLAILKRMNVKAASVVLLVPGVLPHFFYLGGGM